MMRRIARLMLIFMLLWLPLQGQAMVQWHDTQDQAQLMSIDDAHHDCHQAGTADDNAPVQNTAGDCHDGNCCYLCHAALIDFGSSAPPVTVSLYRPLPDFGDPSIFFEQPQRPPLV